MRRYARQWKPQLKKKKSFSVPPKREQLKDLVLVDVFTQEKKIFFSD